MKKFYQLLGVFLLPLSCAALTLPTDPEPRVALLEEYTGINCGNCPDGHRYAARLMLAQPDLFIPVCVHAGYYARPSRDQPDYRTDYGESLNTRFDVSSYPCGIINRSPFQKEDDYILGRGKWGSASHAVTAEISPVNLRCAATYTPAGRTLDIEVEGLLTGEPDGALALSVIMLESGIQGPQSGGLVGDEYIHRHMLRDCLLDAEALADARTKGDRFRKKLTYTIPAAFKEVECRPERVELVAFVTDASGAVVTAAKCFPESDSFPADAAAAVAAGKIAAPATYGYNFVNVSVTSEMIPAITSLTFLTSFNGEEGKSVTVDCHIPREESREIEVPFAHSDFLDTGNSVSVVLTAINGTPVNSGNPITIDFDAPASIPADIIVKIKTDEEAADNRYLIRDADGRIVKELGSWADGSVSENELSISLEPDAIYCLEVTDAWANGILEPRGFVKVYDTDGNILAQNLDIKEFGWRQFFYTGGSAGSAAVGEASAQALVIDPISGRVTMEGASTIHVYAADGSLVSVDGRLSQLRPGLYIAVGKTHDGVVKSAKFTY